MDILDAFVNLRAGAWPLNPRRVAPLSSRAGTSWMSRSATVGMTSPYGFDGKTVETSPAFDPWTAPLAEESHR
jgi:hypothetical protein